MSEPEGPGRPEIIERVVELLPRGMAPERRRLLAAFAEAYLRRLTDDDLAALLPEDLAAEVVDAFGFLEERDGHQVAVRVFDPAAYPTAGSVVEVVTDDRPFLVDSVTNAIVRRGVHPVRMLHPVVGTVRDADGDLLDVRHAREMEVRESFQHFELERRLEEEEKRELDGELRKVLHDVIVAVEDFDPMQDAVRRMIELVRASTARYSEVEISEAVAFLEWLLDLNFVFLGYREYEITDTPEGRVIRVVPGSGLGILRNEAGSRFADAVRFDDLPPDLRDRYERGHLVVITKTNAFSTVHRDARMDYVGVRRVDAQGRVVGEARLVGLFTSKAYMTEAAEIPILRRKLRAILEAEDLIEGSHDYKLLVQLFDSFPKDELFSASIPDLRRSLVGLLHTEERRGVRLFVRRDLLLRSVSVLVVLPRDVFNPDLRRRLQRLFQERFCGSAVDYRLSLGETGDARLHFTVWVEGREVPDVPFDELEAQVLEMARTWEDRVRDELARRVGERAAEGLAARWCPLFPAYYRDATPLRIVAGDVLAVDRLAAGDDRILVALQNEVDGADGMTRLAVYGKEGKLDLSEMLPVLENLGLRVVEEVPTRLTDGTTVIHDFGVVGSDGAQLDVRRVGDRVAAAAAAVLLGEVESDPINQLVVTSGLDHRQVQILRAYRTYWRLVTPTFSEAYLTATLVAHPETAHELHRLFEARFGPDGDEAAEAQIRGRILHELDEVTSLDEDRILRAFLGLIDATVRTNAFRDGAESFAVKLRSAQVPQVPDPKPLYEIFVLAPHVEGVHLRGGPVARGGIRWSDRREDYRTEVLGLMKAQMTKNAVIVPTGAKGGFVLRQPDPDRPLPEQVTAAYRTFIRGLLDLTDNLVKGEVRHPPGVRVHDGPDPYLVVAADKGTAHLSDTANELAAEYGYWLGDAFASGGRVGYDHKALAITARGAWQSVRRHFAELGVDPDRDPVTVVGIGDMSGDVFGNGMLLSRSIKLIAAFDHRHVFVDPDPDPERSYEERRRLAAMERSSWDDYDRSLLSPGGGVWSRRAKRIDLSPEARRALGIDVAAVTPDELIKAILRAPVDLLWNGGIGTFVRASDETDEQVRDRTNDAIRVTAADLRCRVVGEGGNLGFTQRARIEFDRLGGRIFTDFIDNAGGVHCSDREVNLKVLLGLARERGELAPEERDRLLSEAADDVVRAVVYENFLQAQILGQETTRSGDRLDAYEDLMSRLEADGLLDRRLEFLPTTEDMAERARDRERMARPELAALLAYAKRHLTATLLASDLPEHPHFSPDLRAYFPEAIAERFGHLVDEHPLRRELVATIVANQVVDSQGPTFVTRLEMETGAAAPAVVQAYRVARSLTGATERWRTVEELGGRVPTEVLDRLLADVDDLVEGVTRWYLVRRRVADIAAEIRVAGPAFERLAEQLPSVGPEDWRREREEQARRLEELGIPADLARRHAFQPELFHGPDIVDVTRASGRPVEDVARIFFRAGQAFRIDWLEEQVAALSAGTRWQRLAVQALDDELLLLRRQLAERVIEEAYDMPADEAVDAYLLAHAAGEGRLIRFMRQLAREGIADPGTALVAIRQIRAFVG